ncbi:uncharacterized membrane protein [Hoeflea halophila]|uniref:Uncharacterized membrane protein n=1 Tax=Hoeflea halophila TaxID=714899 RepID=A0A286I017_9HYPH|nr:DUF2306 domain-containing protein [Hoeflea halophila]SOE13428.1 uncharacterized membrane protein [Hoeflea halophila]
MTLEPLLNASPAIQLHVLAVVPAAVIDGILLLGRKGTPAHRSAGRVWIALMLLAALSSFFIHTIRLWGPFSPIHLLSVLTLVGVFAVVWSARRRDFINHQRAVKSLYFGAIGIAGGFSFLPGRIMHEVVFGSAGASAASVPPTTLATGPAAAVYIVTAAPVWVWPLLIALIALGVSRMRDRVLPVWRLMLLPALLMVAMLLPVLTGGIDASGLSAMAAGLGLGLAAGFMTMRSAVATRLEGNRVLVRGEVISLLALLAIFAFRFAAGAIAAVAPDLMERAGVRELFVAAPVFLASVMAARALAQAGYNPLARKSRRLTLEAEC